MHVQKEEGRGGEGGEMDEQPQSPFTAGIFEPRSGASNHVDPAASRLLHVVHFSSSEIVWI